MRTSKKAALCVSLIILSALANVYAAFQIAWNTRVTLRVDPLSPRSADLTVSCNPSTISIGNTATINGKLVNATSRQGIEGQTLSLRYKQGGSASWTYITSVMTISDGTYSYLWTDASTLPAGFYAVNATFLGSANYDPWSSATDFRVVATIETTGYEAYRIGDSVFGQINITSVGGPSDCSVRFEVMSPSGGQIYKEVEYVSLFADEETPVFFNWLSDKLPLGDYSTRFMVYSAIGNLVFDSGWFFGFSVSEPVFTYDLGSFSENEHRGSAFPELYLERGQEAVFNFSLSVWIGYFDIYVRATSFSDFLVEVGNQTLSMTRSMYVVQGSSSIRVYNAPSGNYRIIFNSLSRNAQILEVSIDTASRAYPFFGALTMTDGLSYVDEIEGLCGISKVYYVSISHCTNRSENLEFSVRNETTGALLHFDEQNVTLFSMNEIAGFTVQFDFPVFSASYNLVFNATLSESKESMFWTIPFSARRLSHNITLKEDVYISYYKLPTALQFWDHDFYQVSREELEALNVTDVKIIDIEVQDDLLKNVTISFHVKNEYAKQLLWMTAHVYYDLYFYPVEVNGRNLNVYKSLMMYGEEEDIIVRGVPVTYQEGSPKVHLNITFSKSPGANVLDWLIRRLLKALGFSWLPAFSDVVMTVVDSLIDYIVLRTSAEDVERVLEAVLGNLLDFYMEKLFGTADLHRICTQIPPYMIVMTMIEEEPSIAWSILGKFLHHILEMFKNKPDYAKAFLEIIKSAIQQVTKNIVKMPALETIKGAIDSLIKFLDVVEAIFDGTVKLLAPDAERKVSTAWFNDPIEGEFVEVGLGDPLMNIRFLGNISNSLFNVTRLYSIQDLWLNVSATSNGNTSFTLQILPSTNYTGTFVSAFSDPDVRSSLLTYYGIMTNETVLLTGNQSLIVQGNGTLLGSYKEVSLHIHEDQIEGYVQQPFQAPVENNTCYVNLPMIYSFGKNLTYSLELVLPPCSSNIIVLSDGNYTIDGRIIMWNEPVDQISVQFTVLLGDVDGDGDVDGFDLTRMCGAYGSSSGDPMWDEECDINGDGIIDGFDLTPACGNYGMSVSVSLSDSITNESTRLRKAWEKR